MCKLKKPKNKIVNQMHLTASDIPLKTEEPVEVSYINILLINYCEHDVGLNTIVPHHSSIQSSFFFDM